MNEILESSPVFQYINLVLGCISIIGCFFILLIFIIYKSIRSFAMEQVIYLSISCLISTFAYIMQGLNREKVRLSNNLEMFNICKIQSFLMVWFENSKFISATLISFTVYRSVIYFEEINTKKTHLRRIIYILIIFALPFIFSLVGLICFTVFGPSDFWCYIELRSSLEDNFDNKIFYLIAYLLIWICIFLNFYFNIRIISYLKKEYSNHEVEIKSTELYVKKLTIFPIVQTILMLPGTLNRLMELCFEENLSVLKLIQVTAACSTGLIYSIVYGMNNQIKDLLKNSFLRLTGRDTINNFQDDSSSIFFNNNGNNVDNHLSFIE